MRPSKTSGLGAFLLLATFGALAGQEFPALGSDVPAGDGTIVPCEFERLDETLQCGTFRVWEDREARAGRTVDIAFVVLPALDPSAGHRDAVLPLPGGPGQAFTQIAAGFAQFASYLREDRDILLVDVRGVGRSQTLDCPDFEIDLADRFGTVFPPEHIRMCRDALAERARLDLYTTGISVDDLEELRRWLEYDAVNLIGVSYGTRVAQVYMRRHPDAVRTVVLNSVAPVFRLGYVDMARSLQRSLDLVVADCESDAECATEHPQLSGRLAEVLARLERGPVKLDIEGETIGFTKGDFAYALRGLLYGRASEVPGFISRASEGDFEGLAAYYLERAGWVGSPGGEAGYHLSALCPEDILPLTDEMVEESSEGTFMGDHLIAGYRGACRIWGAKPLQDTFWEPVESDHPVLVISGEFDPVTPPAYGDAVAEHLPNSVHVVVPGGGHGPRNDCTSRLEAQLLAEASVESLDISCPVDR